MTIEMKVNWQHAFLQNNFVTHLKNPEKIEDHEDHAMRAHLIRKKQENKQANDKKMTPV